MQLADNAMNQLAHFFKLQTLFKLSNIGLALLIPGLVLGSSASAHLMVAQKGTLNLSGDGAYLVASVATSSLTDVDDNRDSLLSAEELSRHKTSILEQLRSGLVLSDASGSRPLEGIMLSLSPADAQEGQPADQLIVMGRYALGTDTSLTFQAGLWGNTEAERSLSLTVTKALEDERLLVLTPERSQATLYESALGILMSYLSLGLMHVFGGLDHLLFLLVVLATGWGWRKILTALSVFTLGHALSLVAVIFGGVTAPARIVEPAIAATIIGLALYDVWLARNGRTPPVPRLALIFACSLIHGLGLAGALAELGVSPVHQGATLLGFNLGIELAQVTIATLSLAVFAMLHHLFGKRSVQMLSSVMTVCAVLAGSVWLVERVMF